MDSVRAFDGQPSAAESKERLERLWGLRILGGPEFNEPLVETATEGHNPVQNPPLKGKRKYTKFLNNSASLVSEIRVRRYITL